MSPTRVTRDRLIRAAAEVRAAAHAPYSQYRVGAAVLAADGRLFVGCNVENASYGLSVCAERNAIGAAVAAGSRKLPVLAVVTASDPPVAPCGACRQVIAEFGVETVILASTTGAVRVLTGEELLPLPFGLARPRAG